MLNWLKARVLYLLHLLPTRFICWFEHKYQKFSRFNERPVEFAFVFRNIAKYYPKTILDVGTGQSALPHLMRNTGALVTSVDNIKDYWPAGMANRHYHILNDDITRTKLTQKFDMITCVSVLEHIEDHDAAVKNMLSLLNPGGHLVLTCPYTEGQYVKNVYKLPGSAYGQDVAFICQSYTREQLEKWFREDEAEIVEQEFWQFWDGDVWTVGNQIIPPKQSGPAEKHQITCLLVRKK